MICSWARLIRAPEGEFQAQAIISRAATLRRYRFAARREMPDDDVTLIAIRWFCCDDTPDELRASVAAMRRKHSNTVIQDQRAADEASQPRFNHLGVDGA